MRMRMFCAACLAFAMPGAWAIPITYSFEMPAFLNGDLAGQTSLLDVTVDNGGSETVNQSYLNTQITELAVSVGALVIDPPSIVSTFGSIPYVTTDGHGLASLDLSAAVHSVVVAGSLVSGPSAGSIQLGTRGTSGPGPGPAQYYVELPFGQFGVNDKHFAVDAMPTLAVPEPTTFSLLGAGLLAVVLLSLGKRQSEPVRP